MDHEYLHLLYVRASRPLELLHPDHRIKNTYRNVKISVAEVIKKGDFVFVVDLLAWDGAEHFHSPAISSTIRPITMCGCRVRAPVFTRHTHSLPVAKIVC